MSGPPVAEGAPPAPLPATSPPPASLSAASPSPAAGERGAASSGRAVPAALFLATVLTTLWVGGGLEIAGNPLGEGAGGGTLGERILWRLGQGIPYSAALLSILLAHEMGHSLAARAYRVDASLPYFLPMPFNLIGTLGAFIRIRSPFPHRRALSDIGLAGPFAGFLFCLPLLAVGAASSRPGPATAAGIEIGEPLAFRFFAWAFGPAVSEGQILFLSPVALAGWFGLLLTAINLLPMGQLDGGHALYALARRRAVRISRAVHLAMFPLALWSPGWLVWGLLCWFLGARRPHPPTLDDEAPLPRSRRAITALAALVLVLSFTPEPVVVRWSELWP